MVGICWISRKGGILEKGGGAGQVELEKRGMTPLTNYAKGKNMQRRIHNPAKHLRWSFCQK